MQWSLFHWNLPVIDTSHIWTHSELLHNYHTGSNLRKPWFIQLFSSGGNRFILTEYKWNCNTSNQLWAWNKLSRIYTHSKIDEMNAECNLDTMPQESITGDFIVLLSHVSHFKTFLYVVSNTELKLIIRFPWRECLKLYVYIYSCIILHYLPHTYCASLLQVQSRAGSDAKLRLSYKHAYA